MTYWAQLLHFYQPPTQTHDILQKVAQESYRPLIEVLCAHTNARVAVNVQGVLTDMLLEHGLKGVVDGLRVLAEKGQVEFVGSGKFHPILPLIPEGHRRKAIAENWSANREGFGRTFQPKGFFPPEMCYGPEIIEPIATAGHEWLVMSGVACNAPWPTDKVYRVKSGESELAVLFRDDVRSNRISFRETNPQEFLADLAGIGRPRSNYVLTAMDAETFGHHITGWERDFLAQTFEMMEKRKGGAAPAVEMVFPSDLLTLFPSAGVIDPPRASWSTSEGDLAAHNPYPLWKSPGNQLHALQWEYVDHCVGLAHAAAQHADNEESRKFAALAAERLEPGLHSCQFWWASRRPMWDATLIYRGLLLLSEVVLDAGHAVAASGAEPDVKQEARWRVAAANETRLAIERVLLEANPA